MQGIKISHNFGGNRHPKVFSICFVGQVLTAILLNANRCYRDRYPLTSQLIQGDRIPEFDNFYLDFNGIIHNCAHPNDDDAHARITEEQIFTSIFTYVDYIFSKINPKKLFFIAVDGVAPRAKMNQQRSRRFKNAKKAQELIEEALKKGEKLPEEKAFDSNCITPGTPFMARLSNQLRYFINAKITNDADWRQVQVVLSGHEVPGEGEHKIMEYIRSSRAQPDYNPNTRHCLYGLDADLIMLGLISHDPHFCLLREEVKYGPVRKKHNSGPKYTNFFLFHLSLMREYLDMEFRDIQDQLPFKYSLERVIDDFVLLAVFVGNDFLPNLPDLHIHSNGFGKLFDVYKSVLPCLDGYLNENGTINTKRLQVVLDEMVIWEREIFEKDYADMNWVKEKREGYNQGVDPITHGSRLAPTHIQKKLLRKIKSFVLSQRKASCTSEQQIADVLTLENNFASRDKIFIKALAEHWGLEVSWDEFDENGVNMVCLRFSSALRGSGSTDRSDIRIVEGVMNLTMHNVGDMSGTWGSRWGDESSVATEDIGDFSDWVRIKSSEDDDDDDDSEGLGGSRTEISDEDDGENELAMEGALNKYDKTQMNQWKRDYYRVKLNISYDDEDQMRALTYQYVQGLQWVMHYYYTGVASWRWFYSYYYAPRISDLRGVDKMSFTFELGQPLRPFEQLMGVLPVASREHIPLAYRDLMYDANSPILDFYPLKFESDLNGKKHDWEAIEKIPFIDEKRLLEAMSRREHRLTKEEKQRNTSGINLKFTYDEENTSLYSSPLPGTFPAITRCRCKMEKFDLPTLHGLRLVQGLCDGVLLRKNALAGFPSFETLPHAAELRLSNADAYRFKSGAKSMVLDITNPYKGEKTELIAERFLSKRVFIDWPFLREGKVVAVSDSLSKYEKVSLRPGLRPKVVRTLHEPRVANAWSASIKRIKGEWLEKCKVNAGEINALLHIRPLRGLKRLDTGALVKDYEGAENEVEHAVQMCVQEVGSEDPRYLEREAPPISEEFPQGSNVFFLGESAYGTAAEVYATEKNTLCVSLVSDPSEKTELNAFKSIIANRNAGRYYPSYHAASMIGISGKALSKITSSFMVLGQDEQKTNWGLNLKFDAKALKVINYSRKDGQSWEFSEKAIELVREYKANFPEVFRCLDGRWDVMPKIEEIFIRGDAEARAEQLEAWLKSKGVHDFRRVSLFCDQLEEGTVAEIEALADRIHKAHASLIQKRVSFKNITRQAVLKPSHAGYWLLNQTFALGDRVVMVRDSGSVPLATKGVVVGINSKTIDVIWDSTFISGDTLDGRCSQYRGAEVKFDSCLNLTNPQFVKSLQPHAKPVPAIASPFRPSFGPRPFVQPPPEQDAASGFKPALTARPYAQHTATQNRGWGPPAQGAIGGGASHQSQLSYSQMAKAGHAHSSTHSPQQQHPHILHMSLSSESHAWVTAQNQAFAIESPPRGGGPGDRGRGRGRGRGWGASF
ncbi:hypothetical protein AX16_006403 [Volvariella volvacea WC 439]|nr:hypothetical protein AX16_006403 [Volvariella volvacea WC 439]